MDLLESGAEHKSTWVRCLREIDRKYTYRFVFGFRVRAPLSLLPPTRVLAPVKARISARVGSARCPFSERRRASVVEEERVDALFKTRGRPCVRAFLASREGRVYTCDRDPFRTHPAVVMRRSLRRSRHADSREGAGDSQPRSVGTQLYFE